MAPDHEPSAAIYLIPFVADHRNPVMEAVSTEEVVSSTFQSKKELVTLSEHVVEIVADAGEGAQKAGQTFATLSAKMGNGIWTVEIIPADIQPPARQPAGASGIRIRVGTDAVTNMGDGVDLIVAFNEQALLGRLEQVDFHPDSRIILENKWRTHADPDIVAAYVTVYDRLVDKGYNVIEIPLEEECAKIVANPSLGKNMFVLGLLCSAYSRDLPIARNSIAFTFRHKSQAIIDSNIKLLDAGYAWAEEFLDFKFEIPASENDDAQIVVNGNQALALGVMASGMEVCSMYPITPATSTSLYLAEVFENFGGVVHQAEDEIAAAAVAIGASYAGKCALTITSGPGLALKTELLGLATMAEIPLVVINVQRGGPSTGLPTKVEQGDLLMALFSTHGDAPKVVMAPATIEDCFYSVITARKIAETFRVPVLILSDANLATGQQPFTRPDFSSDWVAPPIDQRPVPDGARPYDWDEKTGMSRRFIPGQPGGMHTVTGLAHTDDSKVAYGPKVNQDAMKARSRKIAALQRTLKTPEVTGEPEGDVLVIGWGSTKGAIDEAVARLQKEGLRVSTLHLRFLQPMAPGIGEILKRFRRTLTVEINYSDEVDGEVVTDENRRYSNLALLLRARYLVDVQNYSNVFGQPMKPSLIEQAVREHLKELDQES